MVGGGSFLKPQRPEPSEKWKSGVPAQRQGIMNEDLGSAEPSAYGQHRPAQTGKRRERRIQAPEPAAQCRGVGHTIGIFDCGRCRFPATTLDEIAVQRLTARNQAVVAVWWREGRQEGECLTTTVADAAANPDPIMMFIMGLLAPASVTDDGILHANRAATRNGLRARLGPIGFEVVLRGGKRDKQYRDRGGPARDVGLSQDPNSRTGPSPPE